MIQDAHALQVPVTIGDRFPSEHAATAISQPGGMLTYTQSMRLRVVPPGLDTHLGLDRYIKLCTETAKPVASIDPWPMDKDGFLFKFSNQYLNVLALSLGVHDNWARMSDHLYWSNLDLTIRDTDWETSRKAQTRREIYFSSYDCRLPMRE
ncbi:hypothetical protein ASPWEDRAFT_385106 [Aspergillus wentii DTO 134E9]|uniref:Uncharacterized protein n=1 Tax=Aspergillus wentii DTO 134E9 TaxID=1073089 RepID=A0A1L9RXF7_ASPWE|nr:uncharacterized protein ASPWEDRAFT_385106 [Aspergillus wentii DTO 134E9]OJJ39630.1 hypothetical protein ASPWEDRAFT_385106 [Aspergillus wentii DTO 134E9]